MMNPTTCSGQVKRTRLSQQGVTFLLPAAEPIKIAQVDLLMASETKTKFGMKHKVQYVDLLIWVFTTRFRTVHDSLKEQPWAAIWGHICLQQQCKRLVSNARNKLRCTQNHIFFGEIAPCGRVPAWLSHNTMHSHL